MRTLRIEYKGQSIEIPVDEVVGEYRAEDNTLPHAEVRFIVYYGRLIGNEHTVTLEVPLVGERQARARLEGSR